MVNRIPDTNCWLEKCQYIPEDIHLNASNIFLNIKTCYNVVSGVNNCLTFK